MNYRLVDTKAGWRGKTIFETREAAERMAVCFGGAEVEETEEVPEVRETRIGVSS